MHLPKVTNNRVTDVCTTPKSLTTRSLVFASSSKINDVCGMLNIGTLVSPTLPSRPILGLLPYNVWLPVCVSLYTNPSATDALSPGVSYVEPFPPCFMHEAM